MKALAIGLFIILCMLWVGVYMVLVSQSRETFGAGLKVAGVAVAGMTYQQALKAVSVAAQVAPRVTVTTQSQTWVVSAKELGWQPNVLASLAKAVTLTQERSVIEHIKAFLGKPTIHKLPLVVSVNQAQAKSTLNSLTKQHNKKPAAVKTLVSRISQQYTLTSAVIVKQLDLDRAVKIYVGHPYLTKLALPEME